ncbi:Chorismate lyase [Saliniradius amylolyticus]|uniref:Probable chorismate pyruvate-lyase n=1 Tax=Saliniradius amylolyticus TaxID=2183582 RepID=A0A2S2E0N6_9ALTE|nr:chorismate lyase [Saliniradius amylolyticus]AWL10577.1 Chorismate lyase [Saliniradius amylolyticus]
MSNSPLFPLPVAPHWHTANEVVVPEAHLKNWLQDTGSLTERLQAHCRHFEVQLLGQQKTQLSADELEIIGSQLSVVREVILRGDGQPWVAARSVLPKALTEDGPFAALGSQSLGRILFNDHLFERRPFELCQLEAPNLLETLGCESKHRLFGRRSLFCYQHWRVMVAEIFLPQCPAYKLWSPR